MYTNNSILVEASCESFPSRKTQFLEGGENNTLFRETLSLARYNFPSTSHFFRTGRFPMRNAKSLAPVAR